MSKKSLRKYKRSGACQCPICDRVCPLVEHHINGRRVKNANQQWNIAWICPTCHDEIHADITNKIILVGWHNTSLGRKLIWYRDGQEKEDLFEASRPPSYKNGYEF